MRFRWLVFHVLLKKKKYFTGKKWFYLNQYLRTAKVYALHSYKYYILLGIWSSGSCSQDYVKCRLRETKSFLSYELGLLLKLCSSLCICI